MIGHFHAGFRLSRLLEPIGNLLLDARRQGWLEPQQVLREHRLILDAIAARDRRMAAEAMRSHIRHSTEVFLSAFARARVPAGESPDHSLHEGLRAET